MMRTCWIHVVYTNCFLFLFWHSEQLMYTTCSELVFMYWTGKSMNNLLSYCGLVDTTVNTSDKDLPVQQTKTIWIPWFYRIWCIGEKRTYHTVGLWCQGVPKKSYRYLTEWFSYLLGRNFFLNVQEWYFVTKIVLTYCEKKLF